MSKLIITNFCPKSIIERVTLNKHLYNEEIRITIFSPKYIIIRSVMNQELQRSYPAHYTTLFFH